MQRIISYIYHYKKENNILRKCANAGFCRIVQNDGKDAVSLCLKDACGVEGNASLYILKEIKEDSGKEMGYNRTKVDKGLGICGGILNTKLCLDSSDGIYVECAGRIYVALWKEAYETISIMEPSGNGCRVDTEDKDVKSRETDKPQGDKCQREYKKEKSVVDNYADYTRIYNRLCKIRIILDDTEYPAVKMKPYELMLLPRSCWRMANNIFLMESYYRYGHILFMNYRGRYVLAVPWKIDKSMERQALRFGFTECVSGYEYGKEREKRSYYLKIM